MQANMHGLVSCPRPTIMSKMAKIKPFYAWSPAYLEAAQLNWQP